MSKSENVRRHLKDDNRAKMWCNVPGAIAPAARRISRRKILQTGCSVAAGVLNLLTDLRPARSSAPDRNSCTLGFSAYGMKSLKTENAIEIIARTGYDAVELPVMAGWDADSAHWSSQRVAQVAGMLRDRQLQLTSLMEHVFPAPRQDETLHRLRLACQLAHQLAPDRPPIVQTVLGSGQFETKKTMLVDALGQWAQIGRELQTVIAIKPHRGGVVSKPAEAIWVLEQLGNPPWLRMLYDYSHYIYRGLDLEQTIVEALPYTVHVAMKDAVRAGDRIEFRLPGQAGTIDYVKLFRSFYAGGYRGDFNCEVSSMLWRRPDYKPAEACKFCYQAMADMFRRAGIPRPSR